MGVCFGGRCLCLFISLSDAERLVVDWGCAVPLGRARGGGSLYSWLAIRAWRLSCWRFGRRGHAVFIRAIGFKGRCDHRIDFHRFFWLGFVYRLNQPDIRVGASDYNGQYFGNNTPRYAAIGAYQRGFPDCFAGQMERFDGDVF